MTDYNTKPTVLKFYLVEGSSLITVGLDILQYANTDNTQHKLLSRSHTDQPKRMFSTYIAKDHGHYHRARLFLLPQYNLSSCSLLGINLNAKEAHIVVKKNIG